MEQEEVQLKELILDEDFNSLQNLAKEEINLMDILQISHRELQHSNFLAWLFNPNESHGLGDFAIKEFIKLYYRHNQFEDLGLQTKLSVFDFVQLDFDDLVIKREYKNIDLILLSEKNQFCIVLENKIYSRESKNQLKKYRRLIEDEYPFYKHKIYIFLSLFEQYISEEEQEFYIQVTYSYIVKLVEQIVENKGLADKSRFVFEQYLQTLKSMLNQNEQIEEIAQALYKKYKVAFDLVFKYAEPGNRGLIGNVDLLELINKESTIKLLHKNNTWIYFQPSFMFDLIPLLKEKKFIPSDFDLNTDKMFVFEFSIRENFITFAFKIGPGPQEFRKRLYEIYSKHADFFDKVTRKRDSRLSPSWHQAYQRAIVTRSEYDRYVDGDSSELLKLIEKRFREVVDKDICHIERIFKEELSII